MRVVSRPEVLAPTGLMIHVVDATASLVDDLRELVERESPSDDAFRVSAVAGWVRDRLNRDGVEIARAIPCEGCGDALLATVGEGKRPSTLLLGHIDTVWPVGTLQEIPFSNQDGVLRGPGVFDMKAGVAVAMRVLGRLRTRAGAPRVSLFLAPDEEIGSAASRTLLIETAKKHDRVLVLEPSAGGGAAKVARKGTGLFRVGFKGVASHAGLDPEKGASALEAMAEFVLVARRFGSAELGTTVTPTLASSGTKSNVVPDQAEVTLDCRVWAAAEPERVERDLRAWRCRDSRVTVEIVGGFDRPPLMESEGSRALFASAQRIAADLGFELRGERVGGGSDGNLTAAAGVPTLDGLGPSGDGAHARHEHVLLNDLSRRVDLIERLVLA